MNVIEMIKQIRRAKGLTQKQLAEKIGCKQTKIHKIESRDYELKVSDLYKIGEALNVSLSELFYTLSEEGKEELAIKNTFLQSISLFGKENQSRLAMEECAELIQAINKCLRYPDVEERKNNLIEEISDVEIMLYQLKVLFGINEEAISKMKMEKTEREKEIIQAFLGGNTDGN